MNSNDPENTAEYIVKDSPTDNNDVGMYLRVVATYGDRKGSTDAAGAVKTAEYVSENPVQKKRTQANTLPMFTSTPVARRITENTKGDFGAQVKATDADDDILTYWLVAAAPGQNDNAEFGIDRVTGQLEGDRHSELRGC